LLINIVGLQYRELPVGFLEKLDVSFIKFEREPKNIHDKYAVKCISNGFHFGYIESLHSRFVSQLQLRNISAAIKIVSKTQKSVKLDFSFPSQINGYEFKFPENSNCAGIYRIKFNIESKDWYYIGQSVDIGKRLKSHLLQLKDFTHHNLMMLSAWLTNPNSFSCSILYRAASNNSSLQRQIELFEKEIYYINEVGNDSVNAINGDLVFTTDSLKEFDVITKEFKRRIREVRSLKAYQKEKLGKLILDVGIMDRVRIKPDIDIKDTNVLTWLNKTRRSPLDYLPHIRANIYGYFELTTALKKLQKEIQSIDVDKSFVERFKDSLFNKQSSYDTCDLKQLNLFLETLRSYPQDIKAKEIIQNYKTLSNGIITLDSSIFELIEETVIQKLKSFK
jgi:hypothetical protein